MHQGTPHNSPTAAGYGALHALGMLADAFAGAVPTKGDFDAIVKRRGSVKISGQTLKSIIPALTGSDSAAAKAALRKLQRVIDSLLTAARLAESLRKKTGKKGLKERVANLRAIARDLKTLALFCATKFQVRAVTGARGKGIGTKGPSVKAITKLASSEESAKMSIGEEIPSGVPAVAAEISYMGIRADELAGDDYSEIGAALAGYSGACSCGYGASDAEDNIDGGIYDADEDAQLFLLLPRADAKDVQDGTVVYPGAAKALSQGYVTRNSQIAARAFSFLRRQRLSNADNAWAAPHGSPQKLNALRAMTAANSLILHWARQFYNRFLEDQARTSNRGQNTLQQATPGASMSSAAFALNPAMQLSASTAAKNEAASAAAAILRSGPGTVAASAAAMKDPAAKKALSAALQDLREELTEDILEQATFYGRSVAQRNRSMVLSSRLKLRQLLARRRGIIVRQLGLNSAQARALFALESQIMSAVADRAGHEWRLANSKTSPFRAKITFKITFLDKRLALLRARRRAALKFAKLKSGSKGFAGILADVGDAVSDMGWAGVGLGAAGLMIGGAIGSR